MRWTIDAGDRSAFSDARRLIAREIAPQIPDPDDRFAIEAVMGEILAAAAQSGSSTVTVEFQCSRIGAVLETWDDARRFLQRAILCNGPFSPRSPRTSTFGGPMPGITPSCDCPFAHREASRIEATFGSSRAP